MASWLGIGAKKVTGIPGVIYSEDWKPQMKKVKANLLGNVDIAGMDPKSIAFFSLGAAGPEEEPYTWWERMGALPLHPSRLRPRQYYYPITDFSKYGYDDQSPEEQILKAKWMAAMWDLDWKYSLIGISVFSLMTFPMPYAPRMIAISWGALSTIFGQIAYSYVQAMPYREDLDDFIIAKEIWYIKNEEAKRFDLVYPRTPEELARAQGRFAAIEGQSVMTLEESLEAATIVKEDYDNRLSNKPGYAGYDNPMYEGNQKKFNIPKIQL